jgi:hypothetical protein
MPDRGAKHEFHCASCGYHGLVRVLPRGCPLCHAPSPAREPWGGAVLAERVRPVARDRTLVRA